MAAKQMRKVAQGLGISGAALIVALALAFLLASHVGAEQAVAALNHLLSDWCAGNGGPCIPVSL